MSQNTKMIMAFAAGLLIMFLVLTYWPNINPPTPQYSQNLTFKVGVNCWGNETFYSGNVAGSQINVYDMSWSLKETITISSGIFTSALYYASGTQLRYKWTLSGWQTVTGTFIMPYYSNAEDPRSGYHTLNPILLAKNPTTICTYSLNGAYNTSAQMNYDVSGGGTLTVSVEFYNTADETRLFNWADGTYSYVPLVLVENVYYNSTAKPLDVKISGLTLVRAETSTQTGLYIATPAENSLNRDKNQGSGILIENNRITVSFTVDVSQIGSGELGFLRFTLYDNTDVNYFKIYGAVLSGAQTLQSTATWNVRIIP